MNSEFSKAIRNQGDQIAYDHGQWEFQSRQLAYSACHLLKEHIKMMERGAYEGIALLPTSQFLISLAIELICKAYYLKLGIGKREEIYKHDVLDLCQGILFSVRQKELMALAESNVIWAGRYPTPKWTKEKFKEDYDVPSKLIDGVEYLDADKMKNSSSPKRVEELIELYSYLKESWKNIT